MCAQNKSNHKQNLSKSLLKIAALGVLAALITSCGGTSTTPSTPTNQVYIGNTMGLVYQGNNLLAGTASVPVPGNNIGTMVFNPANNTIYAGIGYLGVYSSQGGLWTQIGGGAMPDGNGALPIALGSTGNIYAGTQDENGFNGSVYVSTSGSGNWALVGKESIPDGGGLAAVAVSNSGNVYAGTGIGNVYVSNNSNSTWALVGGGAMPDIGSVISVAVSQSGNVYAGTLYYNFGTASLDGHVYVSTNGTGNWALVGGGAMPDSGSVISVAVSQSGNVYAGSGNGDVYTSNGASTWEIVGGGAMPDSGQVNSVAVSSSGNVYVGTGLYISQTDSFRGDVYVSTSGTGNWGLVGGESVPDGGQVVSIALGSSGNIYSASRYGNVYSTNSSNSPWTGFVSGSVNGYSVNTVAVANNVVYAGTNDGSVYAYSSTSPQWSQIGGGKTPNNEGVFSIATESNGNIYAGTSDGGTNGIVYVANAAKGTVWSAVASGESMPDGGGVNAVAIDTLGNIYAASVNGDVYASSGGTANWAAIGGGAMPDGGIVNSMAILGNNIYAASSGPNLYNGSVFVANSINGTWSQVANESMPDGNSANTVAIDESGNVYVGTGNFINYPYSTGHVYMSASGTGIWQLIGGGTSIPDNSPIVSIALSGNNIYAGTSQGGVYISAIESGTWTNTNYGNGSFVYSIAIGN